VIDGLLGNRAAGYVLAIVGIVAMVDVSAGLPGNPNNVVVAFALEFVVLAVAAGWGSGPALLAAALGAAGFTYLLPPPGSFATVPPENWFVLAAFGVTGVTTGQLSSQARRRARQTEAGRKEAMLLSGLGANGGNGLPDGSLVRRFSMEGVAQLLGVPSKQLNEDLTGGQSLAQILRANGKSLAQGAEAFLGGVQSGLGNAVADGTLTRQQAGAILPRASNRRKTLLQGSSQPGQSAAAPSISGIGLLLDTFA
jgi:K+-sensing histidine kinase KdpD